MRIDQFERLQEIEELLVEAVLIETDPREWPGAGKSPADMTQQERGDRHWAKKGAIGGVAVLRSLQDLSDRHMRNTSSHAPTQDQRDAELDKHIGRYEAEAQKLLARVQGAAGQ